MKTTYLKGKAGLFFTALSLCLCSTAVFAKAGRPSGPNHDLTQEIEFERLSTYPLGPTGAHGWMYVAKQMTIDARQILITEVEPGSPADGILQVGDVILGINGKRFASDARRAFGWAIVEAEKPEKKGRLQLTRWRPIADAATRRGTETEITIQLKTHEPFADTAPYDCPRSAQLMETALARIVELSANKKFGRLDESLLALMAVGRPEHMKIVRDFLHGASWARPDYRISIESGGKITWFAGMHGLILAEYYLATGDAYVLPALRETAIKIAMGQSSGGLWGHGFAWTKNNNGQLHGSLHGYGALNIAGLPCLLTLVLAGKCDIQHPEIDAAIGRAIPFFASFVGHGSIGYGYHRPGLDHYNNGHNAFSSNGKNAIAGLCMTLAGNRVASKYFSMLVTSSYDEREYGHGGNSFHRLWGMMGVSCGGPGAVAAFNRKLHWYNALCRGWDGRMLYQKLGGYYGGATMSLEAAQVLANALPLRKLYITGKDPDKSLWLSDAEVDEAIAAGRWHWADYSRINTEKLIEELDCWSPGAREWIAEELGRRDGRVVPLLLNALSSKSADRRAGACAALGYQGERAASALPALVKALSDRESPVRVAASYAIMRIGKPGREAIPDMLKAVVNLPKEGPLQPTLQALSYSLGAPPVNTAPLYFVGMLPQTPEGENPLDGIDRDVLYPAFARLASDDSARVRDCGVYMLHYFSRDDVKAMAQEIYDLVRELAPNFGMFARRARGHGLDVLARHQIADGVAWTVDAITWQGWGWKMISPHHWQVLQAYGNTARNQLPWLKQSRVKWRSGTDREAIEAAIAAIESDRQKHQTITLVELVGERVDDQLKTASSEAARIRLCRELIKTKPKDYLQHAAALRRLVAMQKTDAVKDLLAALDSSNELLRREAVKIGIDVTGPHWREALTTAKSHRQAAGILTILAGTGNRETLPDIKRELKSEDKARRIAAIHAVGVLGAAADAADLIARLRETTDRDEQAAFEQAIATLVKDPQKILAVLPDAVPDAQPSFVRVLASMDNDAAMDALLGLMTHKNGQVCKAAHEALTRIPDAGLTKRLLKMGATAGNGRTKESIAGLCLNRVIVGHVSPAERWPTLLAILELSNNSPTTAQSVLAELRWVPSLEALRLAREWMGRQTPVDAKGAKKASATKAKEAAARAAVDVAAALDVGDATTRAVAVAAVKQALEVSEDPLTIEAANTWLAKWK